jgi:hypothetical protein
LVILAEVSLAGILASSSGLALIAALMAMMAARLSVIMVRN